VPGDSLLDEQLLYNRASPSYALDWRGILNVHQELTSARPKLTLNREAFQQLLEAAYVIQQQNDRTRAKTLKGNSSRILAEISETQRLLQSGPLDVQEAAALIVARLYAVTAATWAAVGLLDGPVLHYISAHSPGNSTSEAVAVEKSASAECLRSGLIKRYAEIPAAHAAADLLISRGIRSFVAVPVYSEGAIAGVLEAGFPEPNGFDDQDVSACQLMAGLVTESIARAAELEWKQALAAERATMLETLERIKPQLERLVDMPEQAEEEAEIPALDAEELIQATQDTSAPVLCRGCGNMIAEDEGFCGLCGLPSPAQKPSGDIQSKWASLWHMQQAQQATLKAPSEQTEDIDDSEITNTDLLALQRSADRDLAAEVEPEPVEDQPDSLAILPADTDPSTMSASPWTSATRAKQWLKSLESGARKKAWLSTISRQRANIYLGTAILLLITVLAGWGSSTPRATNGAPRLSLMDKTLIALNLAEAPPAPVHMGNPATAVWVDVHTALYYCPGSDSYGKTTGGKMVSQRDAQLDSFQPAFRKPCD
jgi:GAF domain-containing protein